MLFSQSDANKTDHNSKNTKTPKMEVLKHSPRPKHRKSETIEPAEGARSVCFGLRLGTPTGLDQPELQGWVSRQPGTHPY